MGEKTAQELLTAIQKLNHLLEAGQTPGSAASEIILSIVPLLGVVLGCTILFFFLLWRYKIVRELIRSGQYESQTLKNLRALALLVAFLSTMVGLPLTILFYALDGVSYVLLGGLLPFATGIGLLLFVIVSKNMEKV